MNLLSFFSYVCFWIILISHRTQSFTSFPVSSSNNEKHWQLYRDCKLQTKHTWFLTVTATPTDTKGGLLEGLEYDESVEDDFDEDSERDLILQFVDMVQNTPAGELKVDEIDLLREIMSDFPTDVEDLEPAKGVESLLYRMMDEWEAALRDDDHEKKEAFQPQSSDFSQAISTWEKSENSDKAMHVLSILSDQRELFVNGRTTVQPELSSIKTILRILAASRERGLEKQALQVFESLTEYGLAKDPETYGTMITILAKSRTRGAAKRAEKLLREAVKEFPPQLWEEGQKYGIATGVFNAVITAYAKSEEENGPERAEQLIVFMDQLDSDSGSLGICSPNVNSFTSLIDAYAQQNEWDAVSQADSILNRLLDQYLEGNDGLEPNVATWTIVISAWARLSKKGRKGAASRAGRLLKRMEDLYQEDRISFRPDAIAYNTCMNAYAFSKDRESAPDAEKLLEEMNEMYFDGDDSMKPTSRSIKIVTESWITAGDMEKAEDLLDRYEDALLSDDNPKAALDLKDLYRAMLFGYAQQDDTERATFYLNYMIEKNLHPDNICFDRIIETNTRVNKSHSLQNSLEVFEIVEKSRRSGVIQPNERIYTSFIRALTKGKAQGLHEKAGVLLRRMHSLHKAGNKDIEPTIFAYNAVLNACSESRHVENTPLGEAFKTAVIFFTELRNSKKLRPDHVTYGNMLRCALLLPEGDQRDKFVSATFRLCCEQGYMNAFVIRDLQAAASEEAWRSLLNCPEGEVDMDHLPSDWSYVVQKAQNEKESRGRISKSRW